MRLLASIQRQAVDIRFELIPSGVPWIDAEVGGLPRHGVVAATGAAGAGKTTFGLGVATSALARGARVCFLTNELPSTVIAAAERVYERDLRKDIEGKSLAILAFAPFFVNKMKSLQSVEKPLAELGEFIAERGIDVVVFDTFDSMLGWAEGANVKPVVELILNQLRSWGVSVLCTLSDSVDAAVDFCHAADGSLELEPNRLSIRDAKWCNVSGLEVPCHIVQGRGIVVTAFSEPPFEMVASLDDGARVLAPVSTLRPQSAQGPREPLTAEAQLAQAVFGPEPSPGIPAVDIRELASSAPASVSAAPRSLDIIPPRLERGPAVTDTVPPPAMFAVPPTVPPPAMFAVPPTVPPPAMSAVPPTIPPPPVDIGDIVDIAAAPAPTIPPPAYAAATIPPPAPVKASPAAPRSPIVHAAEPAPKGPAQTGLRRIPARVLGETSSRAGAATGRTQR